MLRNQHTVVWAIALCSTTLVRAQGPGTGDRVIDSLGRQSDLTTAQAWRALTTRGLPYAESLPSSAAQMMVTFAWRGDSSTRNVVLVTPLTLVDFGSGIMRRLGRTDVWYATLRLPADTRFAYRFAPNDRLVPFESDTNIGPRMATMRRDTANPRVFDYGAFGQMSLLELPRAPSDSDIYPKPVPHGTTARFAVGGHAIAIYTPAGYNAQTKAALVVFSDGQSYQSLIPAPTILDNLMAERAIGPVIAVFIDNPASTRAQDLDCSVEWSTYLANELVPWLRKHYSVSADARRVVVAGYSLGGLAAACAATAHPDIFGTVIAQSGSFYRAPPSDEPEWLARHLARSPRLPIHFVMSIGRFETAAIPSRDPSMLTASRHLRDVLRAKGYRVDYRELSSGHEHVAWRDVLGDALRTAYAVNGGS
jgi:enterochelin esterase-like enzyme